VCCIRPTLAAREQSWAVVLRWQEARFRGKNCRSDPLNRDPLNRDPLYREEKRMPEELSFAELIQRVRAGDEEAAAVVVRRYEPAIRRTVRIRLSDARLGRVLDSMDICQSVLASFFVRAALGQYDLKGPEQLLQLLATMARHKLADQVDRERAERRDNRRVAGDSDVHQALSPAAGPGEQVANRELLTEVLRRLSPDERRLAEMRQQGMEWAEIAEQLGESPEALRKRLARALDRVGKELHLDEGDDD
jgi:RNA polymerase sigma-70 factor (ECF subfamily)